MTEQPTDETQDEELEPILTEVEEVAGQDPAGAEGRPDPTIDRRVLSLGRRALRSFGGGTSRL